MKNTRQRSERNLIGRRVREARLKCTPPVSQDDLAGRMAAQGIVLDQTAISRIENQTRYLMDYEIAALARCLKTSVAWLFGEKNAHFRRCDDASDGVSLLLISPESLEAFGRQLCVSDGVGNVLVTEIMLNRPCVLAVVGQFVPSGVAQHVWVNREA